jgi:hypothetical protein
MASKLIAPRSRPAYVLIPMPSGNVARIPVEDTDTFDLDEANLFEDTARHRGHTNILDMLHDLRHQGLGRAQAVAVVCEYLNALKQDREDAGK